MKARIYVLGVLIILPLTGMAVSCVRRTVEKAQFAQRKAEEATILALGAQMDAHGAKREAENAKRELKEIKQRLELKSIN